MRGILIALIAFALGACAATGSASGPATPTGSPSDEPPPSSESPTDPADGEPLTGILGADSIEGGCGYLRTDDGTRYEIIYPDGWELRLTPLELRAPDGMVVARGGDEVTVVGEVAGDMVSICQIGPIFRAAAVER